MEGPDFIVEDLLDLSNGGEDTTVTDNFFAGNLTDSSNVTSIDSSNSSVSGHDLPSFSDHFSDDLSVPYDDMAELEWLSNFVEESFSSEDLHKYHSTNFHFPIPTRLSDTNLPLSVPGKARSKRSRVAPCDWSTRLLALSPTSPATSSSDHRIKSSAKYKRHVTGPTGPDGQVRRCLHCASEKTPQWRTGPMGPKTLCNACGVRYKSGRLVPEYRPAASPTYVATKHSNSHRKVVELRRQKEVQMQHQHHQSIMIMGVSSNAGDEFFTHGRHHHFGHDYIHHVI